MEGATKRGGGLVELPLSSQNRPKQRPTLGVAGDQFQLVLRCCGGTRKVSGSSLQIRRLLVKRCVIGRSLERRFRRFQRCSKSRRGEHRRPSGQLPFKSPHLVRMVKLAGEGRIIEGGVNRVQRGNLMPGGAT